MSSVSLTVHYPLHLSGPESYSIILVVQCNILQCLCMSFALNIFSFFNQTGWSSPHMKLAWPNMAPSCLQGCLGASSSWAVLWSNMRKTPYISSWVRLGLLWISTEGFTHLDHLNTHVVTTVQSLMYFTITHTSHQIYWIIFLLIKVLVYPIIKLLS